MATILLVDDEKSVLDMLSACCEEAGHQPIPASSAQEALRLLFKFQPGLVISDIRMPGMTGFDLVKRIREVTDIPVILLSALGGEDEKVAGLKLGADDYLVKPVGIKELSARIEAALRRAKTPISAPKEIYSDGVISINMDRQEAYLRDKKLDLTPKELKLLIFLTQKAGKVVSVSEILRAVWGSLGSSEESVKWHIASLRRKIEAEPHSPKLILTVWGSGYRYERQFSPTV
jgi:DNA-binding response OmpR family regulator